MDTTIKELPIGALAPNDYNPNQMTPEQFAELVTELRRYHEHPDQGQRPAPVVVRQTEAHGYTIVDGEHRWRAAREIGLTTVLSEIVEVDDVEARRQTYKRNRHGNDNQVRLGRMLEQMRNGRSNRELAADLDISEGTIRNAQAYVRAAELRNGYADDPASQAKADFEIAKLTVKQIRKYLGRDASDELGEVSSTWYDLRDLWVNYGCDLDLARKHRTYVDAWPTVGDYLRVLQEEQSNANYIDRVPGRLEVDCFVPYITPDEWRHVLQQTEQYLPDPYERPFAAAIEALTKQKQVPDATSPFVALQRERMKNAPDYITAAVFLSLDEQEFLFDAKADDIPHEEIEALKREIIGLMEMREEFRRKRSESEKRLLNTIESGDPDAVSAAHNDALDPTMLHGAALDVKECWRRKVEQYREDNRLKLRDQMLDDRRMLTKAFVGTLMKDHDLREGRINGEAAPLVLERRINALPWREARLLMGKILFPEVSAGSLWIHMKATKGD